MNATTNLCSETTKQKSPPAETGPGTEPKKRARETPQHPADDLAGRIFPGAAILFNVQHPKDHPRTTRLRDCGLIVQLSCCRRKFLTPLNPPPRGLAKKIEHLTLAGCHRFEYLTLLNTFPDATTRDRQGIDEYYLRDIVGPNPPKV